MSEWEIFLENFKKAIEAKNINNLEELRSQNNLQNMNDISLGPYFAQCGSSMSKWCEFISAVNEDKLEWSDIEISFKYPSGEGNLLKGFYKKSQSGCRKSNRKQNRKSNKKQNRKQNRKSNRKQNRKSKKSKSQKKQSKSRK